MGSRTGSNRKLTIWFLVSILALTIWLLVSITHGAEGVKYGNQGQQKKNYKEGELIVKF